MYYWAPEAAFAPVARKQSRMMKKALLVLSACLVMLAPRLQAQNCGPFQFDDFNPVDSAAAANNPEESFLLSQNYPAALPPAPNGGYPWDKLNFKRDPEKFMRAVLGYCWEGNEEVDFYVQKNTLRKWYHAPMLTRGATGREFVHGLRADRVSEPGELHANQKQKHRNFSVTYYNEPGGYTLGQVWCKPDAPDPAKASFAPGTVMFRLVFTKADTSEGPYLVNTLRWTAYVDAATSSPFGKKGMEDLNLVQVDIGVKTASPDAINGWVFGTFIYNGNTKAEKIMDRLVPIGLQWGNDPALTDSAAKAGAKPAECWINRTIVGANGLVQYLGNNGRVTGIVDGKAGSILSDHAAAGWPSIAVQPQRGMAPAQMSAYFRNLGPGKPFGEGMVSLDYSLDLAMGLYNFYTLKGAPEGAPIFRGDLNEYNELEEGSVPPQAEKPPVEVPKGLVGAKLVKFVFFSVVIVVLIGLLIFNLMRRPR
jgi:hypothetical protein